MRTILGFGMVLLLTIALAVPARVANAGEPQLALEEANAALAAQPPQRDRARNALERAAAAEDQGAASQAYYRLGILDEEDEEFARALTQYRRSLATQPVSSGGHWSRNASKRMQWLAVRSEGNFAPLTRLHRFKRDPALLADAEAVAAFARDTEAFPPGIVRAEARTFVGAAWLGTLHRPHDAVRVFRLVVTDPTADAGTLLVGVRGLVDALLADGQLDEAEKQANLHAVQLEPEVVARVRQLLRRRWLIRSSEMALVVVAGLAAIVLAVRRWPGRARAARPLNLAPAGNRQLDG
jgi:tetratricopeptide (TPR) repeat protein